MAGDSATASFNGVLVIRRKIDEKKTVWERMESFYDQLQLYLDDGTMKSVDKKIWRPSALPKIEETVNK